MHISEGCGSEELQQQLDVLPWALDNLLLENVGTNVAP